MLHTRLQVGLLLGLNLLAVKAFGETEFWFAIVKIVAIVALILGYLTIIASIIGLLLVRGGVLWAVNS